jgi:hypothetical protein
MPPLETLRLNTGRLTDRNCYIKSAPANDRLDYLTQQGVSRDEIARERLPAQLIGLTGGELCMDPDIIAMPDTVLSHSFSAPVLPNAMKPMRTLRGFAGIA